MSAAERTTVGEHTRRNAAALLILDLISDFSFPGGNRLVGPAAKIAGNIARLRQRARQQGVHCIYVNDNRGRWNADRHELIRYAQAGDDKAAALVKLLEPDPDDFFVIKPRHSGFFATPLHTLLNQLGVHTLVLTGVTTHQCVLFTAIDAYMRDFELVIPRDCVASISTADTRNALALFRSSLNAQTPLAAAVRLRGRRRRKRKTAAS